MILTNSTKTFYILTKNGQPISGPLTEYEAVQLKMTKFTVAEQATIAVVPATQDGRILLNE